MFIQGRFMLSTQTNDLTCRLCYRPSDTLHFPVTAVLETFLSPNHLQIPARFGRTINCVSFIQNCNTMI